MVWCDMWPHFSFNISSRSQNAFHERCRAVFGCDLDINMVCGAQLKSDNSNEEDLAGCQRGGVAYRKKPKPPPDGAAVCYMHGCATKIISLSRSLSLCRRFSSPREGYIYICIRGCRGWFFALRSEILNAPLSLRTTLLKKFLLKAPICICALCMQRGQISFLAVRVVMLSARSHAQRWIFKRRRRVQSGGAHNAVSHFTPDSALNAGRLSACKHAVNLIWAPHEIDSEIAARRLGGIPARLAMNRLLLALLLEQTEAEN